jgi:2-oxoglutarate ferredoxin oxidoreductase subunit delta
MSMKMWRKPLDWEEKLAPPAIIYIIESRCKGCGLCVEFCPRNVLKMSDEFNRKGYHPPFVAEPLDCVGCHFCEEVCPEFAIFCENSTDK